MSADAEFELQTPREGLVNITEQVRQAITASGVRDGLCCVFVPHTTAGVTINENADPDVQTDLLLALSRISPDLEEFRHAEGNSAAHTKASLLGSSVTLHVRDGRIRLGTWQGVYFGEFDGPRRRKVWVHVLGKGQG
jgi:secondary thiamine-phosphate synthase enzyme